MVILRLLQHINPLIASWCQSGSKVKSMLTKCIPNFSDRTAYRGDHRKIYLLSSIFHLFKISIDRVYQTFPTERFMEVTIVID